MIRVLDKNLINQIAAGEVIERPSSVIKELVENALDANAKEIDIIIKGIGIEEIIVQDNGDGINYDELPLILERHATSKIYTFDDLSKLKTLGFRGEAIPSIASIAHLKIASRTNKETTGRELSVIDGKIIKDLKIPFNKGTRVIVNNLFYNTPARYKYLKSEYIEKKNIIECVKRLAISNIGVKFRLTIDDSLIISTYGINNYNDLITSLYGYEYSKGVIITNDIISNIKIKLVLFDPSFTRANKNEIYLYCNNRYIQNNMLKESIVNGYQSSIMLNRYPLAFVFIELDPYLIDANIHPQKLTIKIANEYPLRILLTDLVKKAIDTNYIKYQDSNKPFYNIDTSNPSSSLFDSAMLAEDEDIIYKEVSPCQKLPNWEYLATFRDTYLIFTDGKNLYLLDQHAACERINYEFFFKKGVANISCSKQLIPISLTIDKNTLSLIKKNKLFFNKYGFDFNDLGELIQTPILEYNYNYEAILEYLLEKLSSNNTDKLEDFFNYQIKTKACKASIKAKEVLTPLEREKMLRDLNMCVNPYHCPHGRPVIVALDNNQIERLFKRIV